MAVELTKNWRITRNLQGRHTKEKWAYFWNYKERQNNEHSDSKTHKKVQDRFRKLLEGETVGSLKGTDLETKKHSQRALAANKFPKMTVVSIPDDYVHYDITMPRTFSVRECARLQTFPDHFHFYGKRTSGGKLRKIDCPQYTQVGNAVPPRLANCVANHIRSLLIT